MKSWIANIFRYSPVIYKVLLTATGIFLLIYFFPEQERFPYSYREGHLWSYQDLYAPFDFPVLPDSSLLKAKQDSVRRSFPVFLRPAGIDTAVLHRQIADELLTAVRKPSARTRAWADSLFRAVYAKVFVETLPDTLRGHPLLVRQGTSARPVAEDELITPADIKPLLNAALIRVPLSERAAVLGSFFKYLRPAYTVDEKYTHRYLQSALQNIHLPTRFIYKNELIVAKGERITPEKKRILDQLRALYNKDRKNYLAVKGGYLLVLLVMAALFLLYLYYYEKDLFHDNAALTLLWVNIISVAVAVFLVQRYRPHYVYVVPFIVMPVIIQNFFNRRVAMLSLFVGLLVIAIGLPAGMEYTLVQGAAGLAALLSMRNLTTRSEMVWSIFRVVMIYMLTYAGYYLIRQGDWRGMDYLVIVQFVVSGLLAVILMHDLILLYEKTFGRPSDISLLELLNTNNKLLRQLAEKAPGTFQHSVQVANLAEAIANEVDANPLLVRVGALYHDIGKMKNPRYFTENQTSGVNPHENLSPEESARIIIRHVLDGIEMGRRNNLPERIIDFIRTHHGKGLVSYFYTKAKEQNPEVDPEKFRYPGPNPFSKETAILMMADSVEAASKSLQNPTAEQIDRLVEKIIDRQLNEGLLMNSDLSLKEISKAKKVLKSKLKSIYHLRVAYPEAK